MARQIGRANIEWRTNEGQDFTWEQVGIEILMDIRAELRQLNGLLRCPNFIAIPSKLDSIRRQIARRRKPRRAG
jgi:hypothetical protein